MNTNFLHNILNVIGLMIGALLTYDFTQLGLTAESAAMLAAWFILIDKIVKLGINITRDGLAGLTKNQPPVK
jgi:hypothetical protein